MDPSSRTEPASVRVVPSRHAGGRADRPNFGPVSSALHATHTQHTIPSRCCSSRLTALHSSANQRHRCRNETAIAPDFRKTQNAGCVTGSVFRNSSNHCEHNHRRRPVKRTRAQGADESRSAEGRKCRGRIPSGESPGVQRGWKTPGLCRRTGSSGASMTSEGATQCASGMGRRPLETPSSSVLTVGGSLGVRGNRHVQTDHHREARFRIGSGGSVGSLSHH